MSSLQQLLRRIHRFDPGVVFSAISCQLVGGKKKERNSTLESVAKMHMFDPDENFFFHRKKEDGVEFACENSFLVGIVRPNKCDFFSLFLPQYDLFSCLQVMILTPQGLHTTEVPHKY